MADRVRPGDDDHAPRLIDIIRHKISNGSLPIVAPSKTFAGYGDNQQCSACDLSILPAQVEYEFDGEDAKIYHFHAGCYGLWDAEGRRRGGWPDAATVIMALILERPLCMACVVMKSGIAASRVDDTFTHMADVRRVHRDEVGHCRACETVGPLVSLARPDEGRG